MKLKDASVVLTGAAGGIGASVSRQLVSAGARILLVGRTERSILMLARELTDAGADRNQVDALVVDIGSAAARNAIVDAALARRANVLINNAGVSLFGPLTAASPHDIESLLRVNLLAPILLTQALLPVLVRQRSVVLNVGSASGAIGLPGFAVYGASKAGLQLFSEALRRELSDSPIKVLHVAPRAVDTEFNDASAAAFNARNGTASDTAEHVAALICEALRTDRAERYVGWPERLAVRLNGLAPRLMDGVFAKHRQALFDQHRGNAASHIR